MRVSRGVLYFKDPMRLSREHSQGRPQIFGPGFVVRHGFCCGGFEVNLKLYCKIPNSVLREQSKISATSIENVPVTLASGEFSVTIQNGGAKPSDSVPLTAPQFLNYFSGFRVRRIREESPRHTNHVTLKAEVHFTFLLCLSQMSNISNTVIGCDRNRS